MLNAMFTHTRTISLTPPPHACDRPYTPLPFPLPAINLGPDVVEELRLCKQVKAQGTLLEIPCVGGGAGGGGSFSLDDCSHTCLSLTCWPAPGSDRWTST